MTTPESQNRTDRGFEQPNDKTKGGGKDQMQQGGNKPGQQGGGDKTSQTEDHGRHSQR